MVHAYLADTLLWLLSFVLSEGLHELDPVFKTVTLQNEAIKAVARDLKFHHDPVGKCLSDLGGLL